mgnify:CR=1 FL=1
MTSNHTRDQSEHVELDFILVIRFFQFRKEFFNESLRIMNQIDWQEICAEFDKTFSGIFTLHLFNRSIKLLFPTLSHL